jgi:hypothetical protein
VGAPADPPVEPTELSPAAPAASCAEVGDADVVTAHLVLGDGVALTIRKAGDEG